MHTRKKRRFSCFCTYRQLEKPRCSSAAKKCRTKTTTKSQKTDPIPVNTCRSLIDPRKSRYDGRCLCSLCSQPLCRSCASHRAAPRSRKVAHRSATAASTRGRGSFPVRRKQRSPGESVRCSSSWTCNHRQPLRHIPGNHAVAGMAGVYLRERRRRRISCPRM